jgi:S-adenosylmethionine-diacylgycerolhomoserine-N-methlytransferase
VVVQDKLPQRDLPGVFKALLRRWLSIFDVTPRNDLENVMRDLAARRGFTCDFHRLYRGYAFLAALRRPGA